MDNKVTIRDVARLANVSASTVSNLLNERHDRMNEETRERILRAIRQLDYRPNNVARQLKTGQVPIIGLIVPSVANPFWGIATRSVEDAAQSHGYQVLLCSGERNPERERRYAEMLWSYGVQGVIFCSSPLSLDHLADLIRDGLKVIAFGRQTQDAERSVGDSISIDNVLGMRLATNHLLDLGHERIGFISGPLGTVSRLDRLAGYQAALVEAGIEPDPQLIWERTLNSSFGDDEGADIGRQAARELLNKTDPPTALVAINDMYALGAYGGIRDCGLRVPEDVSVVGFDDLVTLAEIADPPLTTIRQPLQEMMDRAVDLLLGRLVDVSSEPPQHLVVRPELIVRSSSSAPFKSPESRSHNESTTQSRSRRPRP